MANRYRGAIGYGHDTETAPGVWEKVITERILIGDVLRNSRQVREGGELNKDVTVQNSISVVADAYANDNFYAIVYAMWNGVKWAVEDVTVQERRLILRLGGKYNGP